MLILAEIMLQLNCCILSVINLVAFLVCLRTVVLKFHQGSFRDYEGCTQRLLMYTLTGFVESVIAVFHIGVGYIVYIVIGAGRFLIVKKYSSQIVVEWKVLEYGDTHVGLYYISCRRDGLAFGIKTSIASRRGTF